MAFQPIYSVKKSDKEIKKIFVRKKRDKKVSCNVCKKDKVKWLDERKYRCKNCFKYGSLTTGTFLAKSKLSLRIWYELTWCFAIGHPAYKASKLNKLSSKICWQTYQKIRKALVIHSLSNKLKITGTVELDESYYGGLFKNLRKEKRWQYRYQGKAKRGRGAKYRKQPVFGIYKRNGSVYLELITECTKAELQEIIKRKIDKKAEVFTDDFRGYNGLVGLGYVHDTIDHGMEIYVDGRIHINGMEGFWGLSKTNMHTYKGIKKKNWILYLKEMEFRYNQRKLNFDKQVLKIIEIIMSYNKEQFRSLSA